MPFLHSNRTGYICEHVIRVMEKFELNPAKLCGLTTDGILSTTGRTNGYTKNFWVP